MLWPTCWQIMKREHSKKLSQVSPSTPGVNLDGIITQKHPMPDQRGGGPMRDLWLQQMHVSQSMMI